MCETGYIRPLSCVNQWHRRNDKSLVSEVTERYRLNMIIEQQLMILMNCI
jgi:hypothetical protein